jgi:hypothetical protein
MVKVLCGVVKVLCGVAYKAVMLQMLYSVRKCDVEVSEFLCFVP